MRPYLESHRPVDPARFTARPTPVLQRYARWLEGAFGRGDADLRHYAAYVAARVVLRSRRDVDGPVAVTRRVARSGNGLHAGTIHRGEGMGDGGA